jgi:hypothetical protein
LHGIPFSPPMRNPWEEPAIFRHKGRRCFGFVLIMQTRKLYFHVS